MQIIHRVVIFFLLMGFFCSAGVLVFVSYSEAAKRKNAFPKNWSECDCTYFPKGKKPGALGCANTAESSPRGLWFKLGTNELFSLGLYDKWRISDDKWRFSGKTIIPLYYRIGDDEPVQDVIGWYPTDKLAFSPDQVLYYKFLQAILKGKRIAIQLSGGPVQYFWKCHKGREEALKYIEMLVATGLLKSKPSTRPPSTPTVPTPRSR